MALHVLRCVLPGQFSAACNSQREYVYIVHKHDQLALNSWKSGCMTQSLSSAVQVAACLRLDEEAFTRLRLLSIQPDAARQPMPVYQVMSWSSS